MSVGRRRMLRSARRAPCFNAAKSLGQALGSLWCLAWPQMYSVDSTPERKQAGTRHGCGPSARPRTPALHGCDVRAPVPHQQQLSGNVPQQVFEKRHHLPSADRSGIQPEIEIPQRDARDDRKRLPVEVILQHWRVASPRPGPAAVRSLAQSAFVEKDDRSPLFLGFFLMSGQVTFFQWRMARSLRSSARPTGRWQLQPSDTSSFHTWPG